MSSRWLASSGDIFIARKGPVTRAAGRLRSSRISRRATRRDHRLEAIEAAEREEKITRVLAAGRTIHPVYQPILDLRTGEAVGVEALARFSALPTRSPDQWFAEAAEVGLGIEIEMAALRVALERLPRLPAGLYMSLNASPTTMMSPEFRSMVADIAAERIVLEVTEHSEVDDYGPFGESISELRSNGVRLAVDDAGAGFSSFLHILNIQPDIIKLDVALTRGIDADPARQALGSALLTFGLDAFNAGLIAEGIETERELTTLRALGYPFGQGYHLGRPAPASEVRLPIHGTEAHMTARAHVHATAHVFADSDTDLVVDAEVGTDFGAEGFTEPEVSDSSVRVPRGRFVNVNVKGNGYENGNGDEHGNCYRNVHGSGHASLPGHGNGNGNDGKSSDLEIPEDHASHNGVGHAPEGSRHTRGGDGTGMKQASGNADDEGETPADQRRAASLAGSQRNNR